MKLIDFKSLGFNLVAQIEMSNVPYELKEICNEYGINYEADDRLCLMASGGNALWKKLPHPLDKENHPIDQYSIDQIKRIDPFARIFFPDNKKTIPLQKIGRILNMSKPSLLGIDINDEFGLWFAFRGVFITKKKFALEVKADFISPCQNCQDKECQNIELFHKARLACPYKNEHRYCDEQIQYHLNCRG